MPAEHVINERLDELCLCSGGPGRSTFIVPRVGRRKILDNIRPPGVTWSKRNPKLAVTWRLRWLPSSMTTSKGPYRDAMSLRKTGSSWLPCSTEMRLPVTTFFSMSTPTIRAFGK
jgi:hypothetical protein